MCWCCIVSQCGSIGLPRMYLIVCQHYYNTHTHTHTHTQHTHSEWRHISAVISKYFFFLGSTPAAPQITQGTSTDGHKTCERHRAVTSIVVIVTAISWSTVIVHYELLNVTQLAVQFLVATLLFCVFVVLLGRRGGEERGRSM